eukprot:6540236-Pyramimonas_sp.AAC.1
MCLGQGPYPALRRFRATDEHPEYWVIPLYPEAAEWPVDAARPEQAILLWEDGRRRACEAPRSSPSSVPSARP